MFLFFLFLFNFSLYIRNFYKYIKYIFCQEKYFSNVIEKKFDNNNENIVYNLINHICNSEKRIMELLTKKCGNFIIQKILTVCKNKSIFLGILGCLTKI